MDDGVTLRPIEESDLPLLARFEWDPVATSEFQWFGFQMDKASKLERRWHEDGLIGDESCYLAVALGDGTCAGMVDWRSTGRFGNCEIGRVIPLGEPVLDRLAAYLDHRARRWPTSTNPHLFIHFRTAARSEAVGPRWIKLTLDLPGTITPIRRDRILHEALATDGDPRRLCDFFGLSISTASRYTDAVREPDNTADHPER